jgi:hypothetical protein
VALKDVQINIPFFLFMNFYRWEGIVRPKSILAIGSEGIGLCWVHMDEDIDQFSGFYEHGNELSGSVKGREFLD